MYKLTDPTKDERNQKCVIIHSKNMAIPNDPKNKDWMAYLAWLEEGNTPEPVDAPVIVESKFAGKRPSELTDSEKDEILFSGLLNKEGGIK